MRLLFLGTLALLVGVLAGCGLDETYTGLGKGALPGDPLYPGGEEEGTVCTCNCTGGGGGGEPRGNDVVVADLAGRGYRFDALVVTGPFTGLIADTLNKYFADEIGKETLNILMRVEVDDRESKQVEFAMGAGDAGEGKYLLGKEQGQLLCKLLGDLLTTVEPTALLIPNAALDPPALPVSELELVARVTVAGDKLGEGVLTGALTGEDAGKVKILGVPLAKFLADSGIAPDLDLDVDGEAESWSFDFSFTAVAATVEDADE